ncbi:MAG: type IV secretory system conjugative DNA transfer family protein [Actinomycetes bacterium]
MSGHEATLHDGLLLGHDVRGWVWSGYQRSALILGPTRSGKTSSVVIPNVLCAAGAVVTTSTKPDVMEATARSRNRSGASLLFDPMGTTPDVPGVHRIGWSPLSGSTSWDGASDIANSMVSASQRRSQQAGGARDHWSERSGALLSTLLYAGALSGEEMGTVVRWADRHHGTDALGLLETNVGSDHPASGLLAGILATDSREQSGIWSTTSGVLSAYRSLGALRTTKSDALDIESFVDAPHTLYVCSPGRQQELLAPLVVGLVREIQSAAYQRSDNDRPVVFALDELANIAPLPDLPQLVSEGGGQGVLTIGCLQDLSQARSRWGREADGFLSLFSTTLVLGGVADISTLRAVSDIAGRTDVTRHSRSTSRDARGARSHSINASARPEERLAVDEIARSTPGTGILIDARKRVGRVNLTVAHRDEPWRSLTARPPRTRIVENRQGHERSGPMP